MSCHDHVNHGWDCPLDDLDDHKQDNDDHGQDDDGQDQDNADPDQDDTDPHQDDRDLDQILSDATDSNGAHPSQTPSPAAKIK